LHSFIITLGAINMNVLNAIGRSVCIWWTYLVPMTVIALVITIPLGVKAMIIGHVITLGIIVYNQRLSTR
jgi:hypothetical protein